MVSWTKVLKCTSCFCIYYEWLNVFFYFVSKMCWFSIFSSPYFLVSTLMPFVALEDSDSIFFSFFVMCDCSWQRQLHQRWSLSCQIPHLHGGVVQLGPLCTHPLRSIPSLCLAKACFSAPQKRNAGSTTPSGSTFHSFSGIL